MIAFWVAEVRTRERIPNVLLLVYHVVCDVGLGFCACQFIDEPNRQKTQREKNRQFKDERLVPAVTFVTAFKATHGRLPSEEEFDRWSVEKRGGHMRLFHFGHVPPDIDLSVTHVPPGEFLITAWRGEWNETYYSQTREYSVDREWDLRFENLTVVLGAVLLGILGWWLLPSPP